MNPIKITLLALGAWIVLTFYMCAIL